ncbi:hypothetical protein DRO61_05565, partial [Candidatus Bathyarchaeota archaeon]
MARMAFKRVLLVKPEGQTGLGFALALIPIGLEYIAASIEDVVEEVTIFDMIHEKHNSFPTILES